MDLLNNYQYFGHEVSYMIQGGTQLYDKNNKLLCDDHGVKVLASDGPATFVRCLDVNRTPDILVVVDGNKSGLNSLWLKQQIEIFKKCDKQSVMAIVRELNNEELQREEDAQTGEKRCRYARVQELSGISNNLFKSTENTKIYDLYDSDKDCDK